MELLEVRGKVLGDRPYIAPGQWDNATRNVASFFLFYYHLPLDDILNRWFVVQVL